MKRKYKVSLKGHNFNSQSAIVTATEVVHNENTTSYDILFGLPTLTDFHVNLDAFEDSTEEEMAAIQTAMDLVLNVFELLNGSKAA